MHRYRGFLGFQIFESYDPQKQISQIEYLAQDFPLTGMQLKTETRYIPDPENDPDGQLLKEVENTWLFNIAWSGNELPAYPFFLYTPKSIERKWELGEPDELISEVTTYNWFDGQDTSTEIPNLEDYGTSFPVEIWAGNIAKLVIDYGGGVKQVSENSYINAFSSWMLGRLHHATNTFVKAGCPDIVRTASFDYYGTTGLLGLENVDPSGSLRLQTHYQHDAFGNITNKTIYGENIVPRSVQRSAYDEKGRYVVESQNALGHSETILTDPATGLVSSRTGPNGLTTSWQYDRLGRPTLEARADGTTTTTAYAWESGVSVSVPLESGGSTTAQEAAWSIASQSSGSAPVKVYHDHQGREIRAVSEAPEGRQVCRDTGYNGIGQTVAVSDAYFAGDTPHYGFSQFDELGRASVVTAPDGTKTAYGYAGLISSVTNNVGATDGAVESRNQVTLTHKNAKGETLKVVDNMGYEIRYEYDSASNLERTIDELGNEVVMEYDLLGRKIRQDDPDMGEWFYVYNVLGELTSQTNANGQVTSMEYDSLGRMTRRTTLEGTAEWFYDHEGTGGKIGALWREDLLDTEGSLITRTTHGYDALGRPLLSLQNVDNKWYYTCNTYDEFSRIASNHRFWRPQSVIASGNELSHEWNSFATVNTFNERGAITKVEDGSGHVWWQINEADFDAKGHLTKYTLGNGTETERSYDPQSGHLESIETLNLASGLHQQDFLHDRLGNLTERGMRRGIQTPLSESFGYDKLNRLVKVDDASSFVVYDALGNIQSKDDAGTYTYSSSSPHAVTSVSSANSVVNYSYDNCGNMLGRSENGTNVSSTAWTSFNKAKTLYNGHDGSEFTYNANNSRITQISFEEGAGTKKLYLAGFEQTETLIGDQYDRANWQWTHKETRVFVSTPSGVIGIHVQDASENVEQRYLHTDHLGSIVAVSGEAESGNAPILAEYSFDAWGKRRDAADWTPLVEGAQASATSLSADRGYTGHEMLDHLGLVHMNGRIYDAHLGRFLSADPIIQAPGDLQSYNRYSYVRNNPLTLIDPSGYSWWSKNITDPVSDFMDEYWLPILITIVAVVVTVVTFGVASGAMGAFASTFWGGVAAGAIAGAAGGFVAGFSGTIAYGGDLSDAFDNALKGALWGGISGALAGGIGHYAKAAEWTAKAKALAHGLRGGVVALAKGDNATAGFFSGATGGMFEGTDTTAIIGAALLGGTASEIAGGKFMSGAVTAAFAVIAAGVYGGRGTEKDPAGKLTIRSDNGENPQGIGSITLMKHGNHSWIEYLKYPKFLAFMPKLMTFGTWQEGGVMENYAGDSASHRTDVASLSVDISASQEAAMMSYVQEFGARGADAWGYWSPCSDFASDLFSVTTGINLQDRHWFGFGYSDPNVLYDSIKSH